MGEAALYGNSNTMDTNKSLQSSLIKTFNSQPALLLLVGAFLLISAHLTYSISLLAWFCLVPFLAYLRLPSIKYKYIKFTAVLLFTWSCIIYKIITPPIPHVLIFMYAIPIVLFHLPAYLVWTRITLNKWNLLLFPVVFMVLEWIQYTFTPLGSWGSIAYTQLEQHSILQSLSLFGMPGLSFIIYMVNLWVYGLLFKEKRVASQWKWLLPLLVLLLFYGELRVDTYRSKGRENFKVATIGTTSEAGGLPLPSIKKNRSDFEGMLQRTRLAAEFGAEMVVWTEAAFITQENYRDAWLEEIKELAAQSQITIVASYVHIVSDKPLRYENNFHYIDGQGEVLQTYLKHEPVPGEPAIVGKEDLKVFDLNHSKVGGAICYDYDFPYLAKEFGRLDADIIALPSSDWRGIDPLHTQMAAFRAVEQGHSVLRSTRFGLSAAINPIGMLSAQQSSFDTNTKIMVASLSKKGLKTIYSVIGDLLVYIAFSYVILLTVKSFRKKLR